MKNKAFFIEGVCITYLIVFDLITAADLMNMEMLYGVTVKGTDVCMYVCCTGL